MKSLILALATGASVAAMLPTAAAAQNSYNAPAYDNGYNRGDNQYNRVDDLDQYRGDRDQYRGDRDQYRGDRDERYYNDRYGNLDRDQRGLMRELDQRYARIDFMIAQGARNGRLRPNQVESYRNQLAALRQRLTWKVAHDRIEPRWAFANTDVLASRIARASGIRNYSYDERR